MALSTATTYQVTGYVPAGGLKDFEERVLNADNLGELLEYFWATAKEVEENYDDGEPPLNASGEPRWARFDYRPVAVTMTITIGKPSKDA